MKSEYPMVELGELLDRVERLQPVDATAVYPMLGVRSFGAGAFAAADLVGTETSYTRLLRVEEDDIVYPKLMAWEGAFARVPADLRGRFVSTEFCTFEPKAGVDPRFVEYALRTPWIADHVAGASGGTNVRRRRLYPDDFLCRTIPLPDIDEQCRIAAHLDGVRLRAERLSASSAIAKSGSAALSDQAIQRIIDTAIASGWAVMPLSTVSTVNPGRTKVSADEIVSFVPMRALDDRTGRITQPELRRAGEIGSGYKQFTRGDVIFARITPCMQNGKCAVVGGELPLVGYGSTEFHVVRPGPEVESGWIHAVLRSRRVRDLAAEHFTGTAGQQRVPASFLENLPIPVPPGIAAQREALEEIERAAERSLRLRSLGEHRGELIDALVPSALNTAFAGLG